MDKPRLLPALRARLGEIAHSPGPAQMLAERLVARADRVFERLEAVSIIAEKVAHTELRILERLEPIVEDLGALVRLELEEALKRRGRKAKDDRVIDVPPR